MEQATRKVQSSLQRSLKIRSHGNPINFLKAITQAYAVQVLCNTVESTVLDKATAVMRKLNAAAQLAYGVKEGWYQVSTVKVDGETIGVIWHNLSPHGILFIQGIAAIDNGDTHWPAFSIAVDRLAELFKVKIVEMKAVRPGSVKQASKFGFVADSICMRKHYV